MQDFINNLENILKDNWFHGAALDKNHLMLLLGVILSDKPKQILELGVGTAYASFSILEAIKYNKIGSLTCVDNGYDINKHDDNGNLKRTTIKSLKDRGVNVIMPTSEYDFVHYSESNSFDLLLSDADHNGTWPDQLSRIIKNGSFMFFHDVNESYPNLLEYHEYFKSKNMPCFLFNKNSRPEERCTRGFLMVINNK